jgi:hypothetical protein
MDIRHQWPVARGARGGTNTPPPPPRPRRCCCCGLLVAGRLTVAVAGLLRSDEPRTQTQNPNPNPTAHLAQDASSRQCLWYLVLLSADLVISNKRATNLLPRQGTHAGKEERRARRKALGPGAAARFSVSSVASRNTGAVRPPRADRFP